jgi:heme exporter protein CcmD
MNMDMGGYGLYIWGSYAAAALVYGWNLLQPVLRRRALRKQIAGNAE